MSILKPHASLPRNVHYHVMLTENERNDLRDLAMQIGVSDSSAIRFALRRMHREIVVKQKEVVHTTKVNAASGATSRKRAHHG